MPTQRWNSASGQWEDYGGHDTTTQARVDVLENAQTSNWNVVLNGSFETWQANGDALNWNSTWQNAPTHLSIGRSVTQVRSGGSSWGVAFITNAAAGDYVWLQSDAVPCSAGQWYEASVYTYVTTSAQVTAKVGVQFGTSASTVNFFDVNTTQLDSGDVATSSGGWQRITARFQVPSGKTAARLIVQGVRTAAGPASVWFDDAGLRLVETPAVATWPRTPGTMMSRVSTVSVAASTVHVVPWDGPQSTDNADSTVWVSTDPTKLTAPIAGRYSLSGVVAFASNTTGYRQVQLRKNGSNILLTVHGAPASGTVHGQAYAVNEIALQAGDYVEVLAYHTATVALAIGGTGNVSGRAGFTWVGPNNS